MTAEIRFYNARGHDRTLTAEQLPKARVSANSLLWINSTEKEFKRLKLPAVMREAREVARIGEAAVRVEGGLYRLAIPVFIAPHGTDTDQLDMIVGTDWLVTMGEGAAIDFADFLCNDVGETMKGQLSGSTLAAALITEHMKRIHDRIAGINREIDRLEERILTGQEKRNTLQIMAVLRRKVSRLREMSETYRQIIHTLNRPDFLPELDRGEKDHFVHLQAGYERLADEVARVRDTVVASFELYATRVAQDTNRLIRTLTIVTIGVGIIAALAGVLGMNFKAGLFESGDHGFYAAAAIMASGLLLTATVAALTYRKP